MTFLIGIPLHLFGLSTISFPGHALEARRVQIIADLQRPDQIERPGTIEIVGRRGGPADAGAPSVSIVENKHRHPRRPGTMERPCLLDNHALELIGGLEGSDAYGSPPGSASRISWGRSAILQADRTHPTTGSGPGASISSHQNSLPAKAPLPS